MVGQRRSMVTPGVSMSTRKQVMPPRARFSGSVTAMTWAKSEKPALLMKRLVPFSTQWSPSSTARVFMPAGSPPASGSVWAKHATFSPRITG